MELRSFSYIFPICILVHTQVSWSKEINAILNLTLNPYRQRNCSWLFYFNRNNEVRVDGKFYCTYCLHFFSPSKEELVTILEDLRDSPQRKVNMRAEMQLRAVYRRSVRASPDPFKRFVLYIILCFMFIVNFWFISLFLNANTIW